MTTESIEIPAERVPPVAADMASSSKIAGGLLGFLTVIVMLAAIGTAINGKHVDRYEAENSARAAGHAVGTVVGLALFVMLPGWFASRAARNASRATRAGALAKQDRSYKWRLSGKYVIAVDADGAPRPTLSFKLNSKLRTMLLALPRAEIRS
jgi:hypothetical protein